MAQPPLTTREDVKLLLQKPVTEEQHNDVLDYLIRMASAKIRSFTRRRFTVPQEEQTRSFPIGSDSMIYLDEVFSEADVLSVAGVYGEWEAFRFVPEEFPTRGGYLHLEAAASGLDRFMFPSDHRDWFTTEIRGPIRHGSVGDSLIVVARYGWPAIPEGIAYEATRTVQEWFESEVADFTTAYDAAQNRFIVPEELPSAVQKAITDWKVPEAVLI